MRKTPRTATTLLALLAAGACSAPPAVNALGATSPGGSAAPAAATPATQKIHPSAIATWFGPGFYGSKTACGQTLTRSVVGVANRTLPCGTLVKVTYGGGAGPVPPPGPGPPTHTPARSGLPGGGAAARGRA